MRLKARLLLTVAAIGVAAVLAAAPAQLGAQTVVFRVAQDPRAMRVEQHADNG